MTRWVVCCGLQRAGSTLQYGLATRLIVTAGRGEGRGHCRPGQFPLFRDLYAGDAWAVIKRHEVGVELVDAFLRGEAVGFYTQRDLRDAVVSYGRMTGLDLGDMGWIRHFATRQVINHRIWSALPLMYCTTFDRLTLDRAGEVRRMAVHLGIDLLQADCQQIADDFAPENQLAWSSELPDGLLAKTHITGTGSGGWQSVLSDEIAAYLDGLNGYLSLDDATL